MFLELFIIAIISSLFNLYYSTDMLPGYTRLCCFFSEWYLWQGQQMLESQQQAIIQIDAINPIDPNMLPIIMPLTLWL